jgi:Fibronectin type III-like domain
MKGFAKVSVGVGAAQHVTIKLRPDTFTYWNETDHAWQTAPGIWRVMI